MSRAGESDSSIGAWTQHAWKLGKWVEGLGVRD